MDTVQGEACVLFALGTEHPDQFVAEYYYAVPLPEPFTEWMI